MTAPANEPSWGTDLNYVSNDSIFFEIILHTL